MKRVLRMVAGFAVLSVGCAGALTGIASASALPQPSITFNHYDCGNGIGQIVPVVPKGTNLQALPQATLDQLGIPPAPKDPADYQTWLRFTTNPIDFGGNGCDTFTYGHEGSPPRTSTSVTQPGGFSPLVTTTTAEYGNWSGLISHDRFFTDALADWHVPYPSGSTSYAYSSTWTTVNTAGTDPYPLVQAGSESDFHPSQLPVTYMWFQAYGPHDQVYQVIPGPFSAGNVAVNDSVATHVAITSGVAYFHLVDMTAGIDHLYSYSQTGGVGDDGHAAYITERTEENGVIPKLANFGTVTMTSVQGASGGVWYQAQASDSVLVRMYDCPNHSTTLANFYQWTGQDSFQTKWYAEGTTGC